MAIGALFKTLTFDGENSGDFGVYITGEAVYNAPERAVEMISVPGRNGSIALDQGRFENIEVSYPAGVFAETQADFAEAVRKFRNALCSKIGYFRLSDEYHPDEYRMAIYKSGLEVGPENIGRAGKFNIVFDCKPQRFLLDGEETRTIGTWGETTIVSGDVVTLTASATDAVKTLSVTLEPKQEGSGTPSPTNVRPISGTDEVRVYVAPTQDESQAETYTTDLGQTVYGGTLDVTSGVLTVDRVLFSRNSATMNNSEAYPGWASAGVKALGFGSVALTNLIGSVGTFATTNTNGNNDILFLPPNKYANLRQTDWINLAVDVEFALPLPTPQTYQLTPSEVMLLVGDNVLWSNGESITVEYGQNPNIVYNPTRFPSKPLIEVVGYGTLTIGDYSIVITGTGAQDIFIDCETLEAYSMTGGIPTPQNDKVSLGNQTPVLVPGINVIDVDANLSTVKIQPRWFVI